MKIDSNEWKELIINGAASLNIDVTHEQTELFAVYAKELINWNKKINLTAITQPADIAVKHFIDSIIPVPFISENSSLLDIGSGGGFPGIPMKILLKSVCVTLIDSSRKKNSFQKQIIRKLGLKNINALHIRAQDLYKNQEFANGYDFIICRALTDLNQFVLMALPLLSEKGVIIALKAKPDQAELESVRSTLKTKFGFASDAFSLTAKEYTLPYIQAKRSVVMLSIGSCDPRANAD